MILSQTVIGKTTRKKNIDFSKLGQKITLSNSSCHKCKTMIPVNEENICRGPLENNANKFKQNNKKKFEPCSRRFHNECLQKYYIDSWKQKLKNPDTWICPVCLGICNCSQCTRKRTKESQLKNQFLAQFDQPEKQNKRTEKQIAKQSKHGHKQIIEISKRGKKTQQHVPLSQHIQQMNEIKFAITEDDWKAYLSAKSKFYDCLNKNDWSYIPELEKLKQKNNDNDNKEEEIINEDQE